VRQHAWRLRDLEQATVEQLRTLTVEDFSGGVDPGAPPAA
jgi:hypothetical protein